MSSHKPFLAVNVSDSDSDSGSSCSFDIDVLCTAGISGLLAGGSGDSDSVGNTKSIARHMAHKYSSTISYMPSWYYLHILQCGFTMNAMGILQPKTTPLPRNDEKRYENEPDIPLAFMAVLGGFGRILQILYDNGVWLNDRERHQIFTALMIAASDSNE